MSNTDKRRAVMNTAWAMVKNNGLNIAEAMKVAWKNIKLKIAMLAGKVRFTFKKADGTIREAVGTLVAGAINYTPNGRGRPTPNHLQLFWDCDAGGYRSFCKTRLMDIMG